MKWPWSKKKAVPKLRDGADAYSIGGGWGNAIQWTSQDTTLTPDSRILRIVGWKRFIPKEGDSLESKMESGKTGIFVIHNVERCGDPPDMFFADAYFLDYQTE
jgi:hypothetical protein